MNTDKKQLSCKLNSEKPKYHKGFSLFDFCKKRASKVQIFGKETLDTDGNIIPFVEQAAMITHYLQMCKTNVVLPYERQAESILNLWYEFVKGEKVQKPEEFKGVSDSVSAYQTYLFQDLFVPPFPAPKKPRFKFVDSFAGIGGFRMAFQNLGGQCVFSSEWDEQA